MADKTEQSKLDLPRGVHANGKKLMIEFNYKGIRCRETLNLLINPKNIKLAERKRLRILDEIACNQFDYAEYFPKSKNLIKLKLTKQTVNFGELLDNQLNEYEKRYSSKNISIATLRSYQYVIETHLNPVFGYMNIHDITHQFIREWISKLNVTAKRTNVILTPMRVVFDNAINKDIITENPLNKIAIRALLANCSKSSKYEIEPFNDEEKQKIINTATGQIKNFIQFAFWTGMRLSEIIGLKWENVCIVEKIINVVEAKVLGTIKTPKTKSGIRQIKMLPYSRESLIAQLEYTGKSIDGYVFHHPNTGRPYATNDQFRRIWVDILKNAQVKYRNPHQMRHTYASTLLLKGNKPLVVAQQLGHKNMQMLLQVYGKYIKNFDDEILI